MSASVRNTWGLGSDFDWYAEKLFEIANKEGVRLLVKVSRPRVAEPKPAKKRAKRA